VRPRLASFGRNHVSSTGGFSWPPSADTGCQTDARRLAFSRFAHKYRILFTFSLVM